MVETPSGNWISAKGFSAAACFGFAPHSSGLSPEARQSAAFSSGRGVPRFNSSSGPASTMSCHRSEAPSETVSEFSDLSILVPGVTTRSTSSVSSQSIKLICHAAHMSVSGCVVLPNTHPDLSTICSCQLYSLASARQAWCHCPAWDPPASTTLKSGSSGALGSSHTLMSSVPGSSPGG